MINFQGWKTNATAIVTILTTLLNVFNIANLTIEQQTALQLTIVTIAGILGNLFATEVQAHSETKTLEITSEKTKGE